MPAISTREAVEKLTRAVEGMHPDDLLEFYNELFPASSKSEVSPEDGGAGDRGKILQQIQRGLEVEEILDLWNVAFPQDRKVYYDEEADAIHFDEEPEALQYAEYTSDIVGLRSGPGFWKVGTLPKARSPIKTPGLGHIGPMSM